MMRTASPRPPVASNSWFACTHPIFGTRWATPSSGRTANACATRSSSAGSSGSSRRGVQPRSTRCGTVSASASGPPWPGIFGVISGAVLRRRGELAVRIALGATHRRIVRLVIGDGARLVTAGTVIAIPGIYLTGQALRGFLVGVSPFDAWTVTAVTIALGSVALLACYAAAPPVAAIEPKQILRDA